MYFFGKEHFLRIAGCFLIEWTNTPLLNNPMALTYVLFNFYRFLIISFDKIRHFEQPLIHTLCELLLILAFATTFPRTKLIFSFERPRGLYFPLFEVLLNHLVEMFQHLV